ncbi:MAG: energy-coupling factor transporter ATPase [Breznakia sp.]
MEIIKVEDLNFSYTENISTLRDISFNVKRGSYTSIIGHNGSGKSTIAKLLIGLIEAESGNIQVAGMQVNEKNVYAIRNHIGVVFQNPDNQFIGSTVADDIAFGLENKQVNTDKMADIIHCYAKRVGMLEYLDKEPTRLSGGQKQRVAIAGILALGLDVIILDEATSMLDPQGKKEINDLVSELNKKNGVTIISITHDMEEVLKSDHVIVLDKGEVKMDGTPEEILKDRQQLLSLQLEVPFVYQVNYVLKKHGISIMQQTTIEGMVDALCQLNFKK